MQKIFFSALALLSTVFLMADFGAENAASTIAVTSSSDLDSFKADRPDFASDNLEFLNTIDREIAQLRSKFADPSVDLEDERVKTFAPKTASLLTSLVHTVADRAKIDRPGVSLLLARNNLQYNAAAQQASQTITTTPATK